MWTFRFGAQRAAAVFGVKCMASDANCIVIIEDDPEIRETIRSVLEFEGYELLLAANGKEGLEILANASFQAPCMILLDLMMPVMNGWEFAAAIRNVRRLSRVPIVVMTAFPESAGALQGYPVLRKPFSLGDLVKIVETSCGGDAC